MIYRVLLFTVVLMGLQSCIGDDIIDDYVEPEVRLIDFVDSLAIGEVYQMTARFFNNVGLEEDLMVGWSSSNPSVAAVSDDGQVFAASRGRATINAMVDYQGDMRSVSRDIVIAEVTVESPSGRSGKLSTTSSYKLEGSFRLSDDSGKLVLALADDYVATDVLPGLFVYLSNNPNTINGALEISAVDIFEGAHSFEVPGDDVGINDYSHVLYFCKPFNVKVGDGSFDN